MYPNIISETKNKWLQKAMVSHSSTLAWKIPWMKEPGRLQSIGSLRVRHNWTTSLSCIGEGNGNPLQCSCLENPRDGGAWWAALYGVTQSQTQLKWLSSSSSSSSSSIPLKLFQSSPECVIFDHSVIVGHVNYMQLKSIFNDFLYVYLSESFIFSLRLLSKIKTTGSKIWYF